MGNTNEKTPGGGPGGERAEHRTSYQIASVNAIKTYVAVVYEPGDVVEVRVIRGRVPNSLLWCRADELANHAGRLAAMNADGWNIYVGANPRQAAGRKCDNAVDVGRCLFADFDGGIDVDDAMTRIGKAALPTPTMTVFSGHGVHVYWRLHEPVEAALWSERQRDLAAFLGSDRKVCNPERIMRLPGFANVKDASNPVDCRIVVADADRRYDLGELLIPDRPAAKLPSQRAARAWVRMAEP